MDQATPWVIAIVSALGTFISTVLAGVQTYRASVQKTKQEDQESKQKEVDATITRLYAYLDRVEKEHNEDRVNLSKLHEDYMVVREELSRCRETTANYKTQLEKLEASLNKKNG